MNEMEELELAQLRERLLHARQALTDTVAAFCPGPHKPQQHRDRKPPWCRACGRDNLGILQREES